MGKLLAGAKIASLACWFVWLGSAGALGACAEDPADSAGGADAQADSPSSDASSRTDGGATGDGGTNPAGDSGAGDAAPSAQCNPNPCLGGGVCRPSGPSFTCDCPLHLTGPTCANAAPAGLSNRPANTTCTAPARAVESTSARWNQKWSSLGGAELMMIHQSPSGYWYEAYRDGRVFVINPSGTRSSTALFTVPVATKIEMGLLSMTLHPNFDSSPYIYVYYTNETGNNGNTVIFVDRYTVTNPTTNPTVDAGSRRSVFMLDRGNTFDNHVGGTLAFGPLDTGAQLYLSTGDAEITDGTCANVTNCTSQNPATFHGKLLRFDVTDTAATGPVTPSIVALGLRNPFRWSFDSVTGDLWIGDVGAGAWEEVSHVPAASLPAVGGAPLNFGWPCYEGFARTNRNGAVCQNLQNHTPPVHVYGRTIGVSVIGGRVYRGTEVSGSVGRYFFNDIFPQSGAQSWRLDPNPSESPANPEDNFLRTDLNQSGFVGYAEDRNGELYAFPRSFSGVFKLEPGTGGTAETMAATLSGTGCFDASGEPRGGMIPYDLNAPLWSDGASKKRWLALPDGQSATLDANGDFVFPSGTILAKEFTKNGARVETRLFVKHPDGVWAGYTYAWLDAAGATLSDAVLLPRGSAVRPIGTTGATWEYPSRTQCLTCHTEAAGFSLGLDVGQLNRDFTYPGGTSANQIHTLRQLGVLTNDTAYLASDRLATYTGDASAEDKARAYLHSNCSSCHRQGGPGFGGRSQMPDVAFRSRATVPSLSSLFCGVTAADNLGLPTGAKLVTPGAPGTWSNLAAGGSVLYLRMSARDSIPGTTGKMPQVGTREIDPQGLQLMETWIGGLTCP